ILAWRPVASVDSPCNRSVTELAPHTSSRSANTLWFLLSYNKRGSLTYCSCRESYNKGSKSEASVVYNIRMGSNSLDSNYWDSRDRQAHTRSHARHARRRARRSIRRRPAPAERRRQSSLLRVSSESLLGVMVRSPN